MDLSLFQPYVVVITENKKEQWIKFYLQLHSPNQVIVFILGPSSMIETRGYDKCIRTVMTL